MFRIEFTPEAIEDLKSLKKFEQRKVLEEIEVQLRHEPDVETRNRKELRPNKLAEWEFRAGRYRVFYDVLHQAVIVKIVAVGYKTGNILVIRGERYEL